MGLFDRFQKVKSATTDGAADTGKDADSRAERLLQEGMAFEQHKELDAALRCYSAAIDLAPGFARAHFHRGQIFQSQGEAGMALQSYDYALQFKPDSAAAHYNRGHALFDLGRKEASVAAYRQAIDLKPDFVDALLALGMVLSDLKRPDKAVVHYRRALELKPDYIEAYFALGDVLAQLGQLDEVVRTYRQALEYQPNMAELHGNLANAMHRLKQYDAAMANYGIVLDAHPDDVKAHNNLGNVLKDVGRLDEAQASYLRALALQPDLAVTHYNLGVLLQKTGALDQALSSYRRALAIDSNYVEALVGQGDILGELGQYDSALASCLRAVEIRPEFAYGYIILGNIHKDLGRIDDALACYMRALAVKPDYAQGHNNVGAIQAAIGRLDEAVVSYRRALEIEPDNADMHMNLGSALADHGQLDEAMACMERALEIKPHNPLALSNLLFICNFLDTQHPTSMLSMAKRYGTMVSECVRPYSSWLSLPDAEKTLRVGLISADLRNHPVGYFIDGVLAATSARLSDRLQLFAYPTRAYDDATSRRIQSYCLGWRLSVGYSDEQLAQQIFDDRIDILIDLDGHTAHNRLPLFARKPAPVQASWLGYFATTGVEAIDYLIADRWSLPESEEAQFTEHVWRLPDTRLCFTPPDARVEVGPLPALTNQFVTFGCFNNLAKINDSVVALWSKILIAVPGSRLFLMAKPLKHPSIKKSISERFIVHGIDPSRLILEGSIPRAEYLAQYNRVDIALDPFPFTGGTTTAEALWMGVPVLTLAGERFLARQGVGLLTNAGLPDWIATDPDDYVKRAASQATDLRRLAALRTALRSQVLASPLFDAPRFAGHFADALRAMWTKWCDAQTSLGSMNP